uniref:Uncharacterized protein n=1 Tax=Eutreptiella gymnastica TaxID=73025 RepID=A0A7S1JA60_9EUGL
MTYAPEHRVLLDQDATYYSAPQTRPSRSLTVARDLTLGFVAASALLLLIAKPSTGPQDVQVAQNLHLQNVHGWLSDSIDVNSKLQPAKSAIAEAPLFRWIRRRSKQEPEPATPARAAEPEPEPEPEPELEEEEEEEEHETFSEKIGGVHHKFEDEVDTLLAADPEDAATQAAAKVVKEHDEWMSGDIDAHAPPVGAPEPEEEEHKHHGVLDHEEEAEEKEKEEVWLSDDIDAHEPRAAVAEPEAEAHEAEEPKHNEEEALLEVKVHESFVEEQHAHEEEDAVPKVHESFAHEAHEAHEVKEEVQEKKEDDAKMEHDE